MELIPTLKRLLNDPYNEQMEQAVVAGKRPVGYTCSYIPSILLSVGDLVPTRVRAPGICGTEIADIYLSNVTCSYTRSLLEFAIDERFNFFTGWVFAASCDHMRRLYDNVNYLLKPDFVHILDIPHRLGETSHTRYVKELHKLISSLERYYGISYDQTVIEDAIHKHNSYVTLISTIGQWRKEKYPSISGAEFHTIMMAYLTVPRDFLEEKLAMFVRTLPDRKRITNYRARLLVVGGQLDDPSYIETIESLGALVVADRFCTGSIPGLDPIAIENDPIESIAHHYLNKISCPRMMEEFDSRLDCLLQTIADYSVDGVLIEYVKFCDLWGIEAPHLVATLRNQGIPAICLEREYRFTGEGQLRTRVQAFLESLGK